MIGDYQLSIPQLPGFDMDDWLKGQANLLQNMSKNARRNSKNLSNKSAGSMDDGMATMPYNPEDLMSKCVQLSVVMSLSFFLRAMFELHPFLQHCPLHPIRTPQPSFLIRCQLMVKVKQWILGLS